MTTENGVEFTGLLGDHGCLYIDLTALLSYAKPSSLAHGRAVNNDVLAPPPPVLPNHILKKRKREDGAAAVDWPHCTRRAEPLQPPRILEI